MNLFNFSWKIEFMKVMNVVGELHKPKWHHQELIQAIYGFHIHLFNIFVHDANLIIP